MKCLIAASLSVAFGLGLCLPAKADGGKVALEAAKQQKTVTVLVTRRVKHGRYSKYMDRHRKFAAHDALGCKEGDIVRIEETRPISKTKRWRVVAKLEKGA